MAFILPLQQYLMRIRGKPSSNNGQRQSNENTTQAQSSAGSVEDAVTEHIAYAARLYAKESDVELVSALANAKPGAVIQMRKEWNQVCVDWTNQRLEEVLSQLNNGLPTEDAARKRLQMWTFLMEYFPDSFLAVVEVAVKGNEQHNPGQPLHWAREKSTDHMNTAFRHMWDRGRGVRKDKDGAYHLAKAIWRLSAQLQLDIEEEREFLGEPRNGTDGTGT